MGTKVQNTAILTVIIIIARYTFSRRWGGLLRGWGSGGGLPRGLGRGGWLTMGWERNGGWLTSGVGEWGWRNARLGEEGGWLTAWVGEECGVAYHGGEGGVGGWLTAGVGDEWGVAYRGGGLVALLGQYPRPDLFRGRGGWQVTCRRVTHTWGCR